MTTYYITKYALTKGVYPNECRPAHGGNRFVRVEDYDFGELFRIGMEAFINRSEAVVKAEQMRVAKIASLKKQIGKLEAMKFEVRS